MDTQLIIDITLGTVLTVMGWVAKELWNTLREMSREIHEIRQEMPTKYVMRSDYKEDLAEIKNMLNKIFDQLHAKVDK
jgi:leucyl aminopeptidase